MKVNTTARGAMLLAISNITLKLLSALYMPILVSILTDDGIAIYSIGYKIFIFLFSITSLGIQPAITKLVIEQRLKYGYNASLKVLKISKKALIFYSGVVSFVITLISFPLTRVFNSEESLLTLIFLLPSIILVSILSSYRGYLQGCEQIDTLSISNIIEQLLNVLISLFFAYKFMKISVELGSAGGTIGTGIGALGGIIYIKHIINKSHRETKFSSSHCSKVNSKDKYILKKLLYYSMPFILIASIQNISSILDMAIVRNLVHYDVNTKTATLEYYTTIINVPFAIVTALGVSILPKIIKHFTEKNRKDLILKTTYIYKLIYIITIPSVFGLIILRKEIFKFVFNRTFGYEIIVYGALLLILLSISSTQNIILQGINKFKFMIKIGILTLIIKIVLNIILVNNEKINIIGIVISSIISLFIVSILNHLALQKYFGVKISLIKHSKIPLISSLIMSICLSIIKYNFNNNIFYNHSSRVNSGIIIVLFILIGSIIYFFTLMLLGGITRYDLDIISPKIYKLLPCILRKNIN